jgi:anti-sigma factor RsiW
VLFPFTVWPIFFWPFLELEKHIHDCSACAVAWRNLQGLKKTLKQDALYFTAPAELRQRIKSELPSPKRAAPQRPAWNWNWLTTAVSGAFAVSFALLFVVVQTRGKLDFSPPVTDLAAQGFPLVGGRIDYVSGRSVAALVFQRHKHVINLYVWPTDGRDSKPAVVPPRQGYNLVRWSAAGMTIWAVSDLNQRELMEFAQDYTADKPPSP